MINNDNFDPGEIAKFEALASRWWDLHGEFKPLHDINPLRMSYITEKVTLSGKKVLDVGCGGGILAEGMAAAGAQVKGIDLGAAPLSVARLHARENALSIDYEQISAELLAEREPGNYDVVTCLEMLEHVPQPEQTIMACAQLAKPGAHLFFSTLNRNPKSYLLAVIGAEYILNLLPKGTHDYTKFIRPSEFATWARRADLDLQDLTGMSYNPLSRHYRLGKDVSVNYLAYCQRS